jgi:hypothetical protein
MIGPLIPMTFQRLKPLLSWKDLAPRRIPILNPVRSAVYPGSSLPDTWYPKRQLKETLSYGIPILSHWRIPIGCCCGGPLLLVQYQLISISKLESGEEQHY